MSNKEYKKLFLVSPKTFEKISHSKSAKKTKDNIVSSQKLSADINKTNALQKWMNERNKLAIQSIRRRRAQTATSNINRRMMDKYQIQRAMDKNMGIVKGETIPLPPPLPDMMTEIQQVAPKQKRRKRGRQAINQSMDQKQYPAVIKPLKFYTRDKKSSKDLKPLKLVHPSYYYTPEELATLDRHLSQYLKMSKDGTFELTEDFDNDDEAVNKDVDDDHPITMPVLPKPAWNEFDTSSFNPDQFSTPTPLEPIKDLAPWSPTTAFQNLRLTDLSPVKQSDLEGFTTVSSKKKKKKMNQTKEFDTPEPMDTVSPRNSGLGASKWFDYILGRRDLKLSEWQSFD